MSFWIDIIDQERLANAQRTSFVSKQHIKN